MICFYLCLLSFCFYVVISQQSSLTMKYIRQNGYDAEIHKVITEDGYILGLQRIISPEDKTEKNKPPLLITHGFMSSSVDWVAYLGNKSLPFMLSRQGYDVWLANARGTADSMQHVKLDAIKDAKEFWDISFHELGYYDLAANIDYILNQTSYDQLFYFGFSQGGLMFYILMSTRPEYNEKIKFASIGAAVPYYKNTNNPFIMFGIYFLPVLEQAMNDLQLYMFPVGLIQSSCQYFHRIKGFETLCKLVLALFGEDSEQFEDRLIPTVFKNFPSQAALKQLIHIYQFYKARKLQQYDYGSKENMRVYRTPQPPVYNISKITVPMAGYFGQNDFFVSVEDAKEYCNISKNVVKMYLIPHEKFNHIDFLIAKDAYKLVYNIIINTMESFK